MMMFNYEQALNTARVMGDGEGTRERGEREWVRDGDGGGSVCRSGKLGRQWWECLFRWFEDYSQHSSARLILTYLTWIP